MQYSVEILHKMSGVVLYDHRNITGECWQDSYSTISSGLIQHPKEKMSR